MSRKDSGGKTLKVYYHAACGTCRKAIGHLKSLDVPMELVPLKEAPPSKEELRQLIAQSGLPVRKWFNTSGEAYRSMGLKERLEGMPEEEQIALLAGNGMLIRRPVVTDGRRVTVGYREDEFNRVWGAKAE
ncbi:MAG TPA: Spx/MgsR family RNA polymerase-binding regulatory protein [Paenibacillaceae bacterium]